MSTTPAMVPPQCEAKFRFAFGAVVRLAVRGPQRFTQKERAPAVIVGRHYPQTRLGPHQPLRRRGVLHRRRLSSAAH